MSAEIDCTLHQIDRPLDNHDLGEDDVGILLDIHVDDRRTARIEGNVRSMDLNRRAEYSCDFSFCYEASMRIGWLNRSIRNEWSNWMTDTRTCRFRLPGCRLTATDCSGVYADLRSWLIENNCFEEAATMNHNCTVSIPG